VSGACSIPTSPGPPVVATFRWPLGEADCALLSSVLAEHLIASHSSNEFCGNADMRYGFSYW
jgi:hypothetical protein